MSRLNYQIAQTQSEYYSIISPAGNKVLVHGVVLNKKTNKAFTANNDFDVMHRAKSKNEHQPVSLSERLVAKIIARVYVAY